MRSSRPPARAGFTLIELLVALVLVPVIGLAVYSVFRAGTDLWRGVQRDIPEERQAVFAHRVDSDLQNLMRHAQVRFHGTPEGMSFCAVVRVPSRKASEEAVGQVAYRFDESARVLLREESDVNRLHKDAPGRISALLRDVASLRISYLVRDEQTKQAGWVEVFEFPDKDVLPIAVKIEYEQEVAGVRSSHQLLVQPGAWG